MKACAYLLHARPKGAAPVDKIQMSHVQREHS